ncbi:hypothetical protein C0J52_19772 [Blattella germanica]|nr:hypothetical protein C0J52_19772 [Blattella germanica]
MKQVKTKNVIVPEIETVNYIFARSCSLMELPKLVMIVANNSGLRTVDNELMKARTDADTSSLRRFKKIRMSILISSSLYTIHRVVQHNVALLKYEEREKKAILRKCKGPKDKPGIYCALGISIGKKENPRKCWRSPRNKADKWRTSQSLRTAVQKPKK